MKKENTIIMLVLIGVMSLLLSGCSGSAENLDEKSIQESSNIQESQKEELQCPKGIGNEPAPGSCPLYRDENKDGYCDFK